MDVTALLKEIERYLAAVALFRALGYEPTWKSESPWLAATDPRQQLPQQ